LERQNFTTNNSGAKQNKNDFPAAVRLMNAISVAPMLSSGQKNLSFSGLSVGDLKRRRAP
jgi:hypothetical protein